jgi:hypothetical protein
MQGKTMYIRPKVVRSSASRSYVHQATFFSYITCTNVPKLGKVMCDCDIYSKLHSVRTVLTVASYTHFCKKKKRNSWSADYRPRN